MYILCTFFSSSIPMNEQKMVSDRQGMWYTLVMKSGNRWNQRDLSRHHFIFRGSYFCLCVSSPERCFHESSRSNYHFHFCFSSEASLNCGVVMVSNPPPPSPIITLLFSIKMRQLNSFCVHFGPSPCISRKKRETMYQASYFQVAFCLYFYFLSCRPCYFGFERPVITIVCNSDD